MSNRKMGGVARFKVYPGGDVTTECADCGLVMDVPQRLFPEERAVIEAAEVLFEGYTVEDQTRDYWKSDTVLDYRLYELFKKVEALKEAV